jgi:hypothetical protein
MLLFRFCRTCGTGPGLSETRECDDEDPFGWFPVAAVLFRRGSEAAAASDPDRAAFLAGGVTRFFFAPSTPLLLLDELVNRSGLDTTTDDEGSDAAALCTMLESASFNNSSLKAGRVRSLSCFQFRFKLNASQQLANCFGSRRYIVEMATPGNYK